MIRLWRHLKPGGHYVIEDTFTSYWAPPSYVYGNPLVGTTLGGKGNVSSST